MTPRSALQSACATCHCADAAAINISRALAPALRT
jgi:hypothetical protein